jgi:hypothetical protein
MPFDASAWRQAAEGANDGDAPPDAEYDAELVASKIATKQEDGRQWVVLTWRVLSGRERDSEWSSMHTIDGYRPDGEHNPGLAYTIQSLAAMGVQVDELQSSRDVEDAVTALRGSAFAVQVKRSGSFVNTYPKRVLTQVAESLPGSGGDAAPPARTSTNAIYGDEPAPLEHQSTPAEFAGRTMVERVGGSDVTPPAPKRGDPNPDEGGDPFLF